MHGKGKGGLITCLVFLILATLFSAVTISIPLFTILRNLEEYKKDLVWFIPFPICILITFILIIVCFVLIGNYKRVNQSSPMFLVYLTLLFSQLPYSIYWFNITGFDDEWNFVPWHNLLVVLIPLIFFILLLAAKLLKSRVMNLIFYLFSIFIFLFFMASNFYLIYLSSIDNGMNAILGHPAMYIPYLCLLEIIFFILFITSIVLTVSCSKRTYEKYNKLNFDENTLKIMIAAIAVIGFQRGLYSRETMNNEVDVLSEEQKAALQEAVHSDEIKKYADNIFADYQFVRDFDNVKKYLQGNK